LGLFPLALTVSLAGWVSVEVKKKLNDSKDFPGTGTRKTIILANGGALHVPRDRIEW
jgi:hypothetical protein